MGHAVGGGRRTEDGRRKGIRVVLVIPVLLAFLSFISCAGKGPLKPEKVASKIVDAPVMVENDRKPPRSLPVNRPVQVTFSSDPVLYAALSGDGKRLAYVLENEGRSSLWLGSGDSAAGAPPHERPADLGRISAPTLSRNGERLAFAATDHDAKGDIYLLSLGSEKEVPRRLTGRDSADGAPALSPDGRRIYFQRLFPGEVLPQLATMDVSAPDGDIPEAETLREGGFPAVSPDGESLAFVSFTEDPGGDIWVLDLKTKAAKPVTTGFSRDLYPAWSADGKWVYFSRFDADTNDDGRIGFEDNGTINRVALEGSDPQAYPLTSETFSAYQPMMTDTRILFLSNINGIGNIWALPLGGEIPKKENARAQLAVARLLASRIPPEDALAVLAYYKVLEDFENDRKTGAQAAYELGKLYRRMGRREAAMGAFERVMAVFKDTHPQEDLAAIRLAALEAEKAWESAPTDVKRRKILKDAVLHMKKISEAARTASPGIDPANAARIKGRGMMARAGLLVNLGQNAASLEEAMSLLERVGMIKDLPPEMKAEALFRKAKAGSRLGRASAVVPIYLSLIKLYPRTPWADRSVEEIIDILLSDTTHERAEDRMQPLARLAETHRESIPQLSFAALNRMGDITYQEGDWPQAKRWYREVLNRYGKGAGSSSKDAPPAQVAAARLALAEILYREELFRQALDLYEKEMAYRPYEDRLYSLARAAYVRKSLAAADFLFGLGEIPAAQKIYHDLIREDPGLVQAHRGYIKCAALMKQIPLVLDRYEAELAKDPDNPVLLYTTGLCLTYLEGQKHLDEARKLIERAVSKQGQNPYFHQTLGYIFEVSETVYGDPGGLEKALSNYRKAYFLNNPQQDPANSANLALNLGNIHFLLGQYGKALERYLERLESKVPFDHEDTEILFYRRLGVPLFR